MNEITRIKPLAPGSKKLYFSCRLLMYTHVTSPLKIINELHIYKQDNILTAWKAKSLS